eukprot:5970-Eustigmatos_ZCMA.PRE.1
MSPNMSVPVCSLCDDDSVVSPSGRVDGSMLGKSFRATGSSSSMNGTMTKNANGTRRNKSAAVRGSCRLSRRVRVWPLSSRRTMDHEVFTSDHSSL